MMDDFMNYMGIEKGWTIPFSGKIEGKWMRQDATLMLNHSITKDALACESCHAPKERGIMPFEELGYPRERVEDLRNLDELRMITPRAPSTTKPAPQISATKPAPQISTTKPATPVRVAAR
ncbi:MAG TPA: hypothetical protein VNA88_14075, partial [Candidatus Kapabacteria bacterium]|nr:hypothetical protein [Candidatus Kapabacteria bacterium]